MENDKRIDDIVAMLDNFMANKGGHMNITVDDTGKVVADGKTVNQKNDSECSEGDVACNIPTLFEGLDNESKK